ncbi:hypothetical protein HII31_05465 [Pseudocercospora fuligena]|uniref:Uncharacterized protein n=1 Tax=Pseudocercospora fuligena TaxID=685502 RepID=A0A8H6RKP5_9PEZI|nr:hypothetical protein HII31_05465 [Pseudocercospora fuligena]
MRQGGVEYAPAGFHATGDGSDVRGQMRHQPQMQQQRNQTSAPLQEHIAQLQPSFEHSQVQTDEVLPSKRRKLNSESTPKTIIDKALTRADDTHRKSNGWPAMPPPDMSLPQFVNPQDLLLRPITVRPEFNWDNKFLFQSRVFEQDELVPIRPVGRPLGSRKQPLPSASRSNMQAVEDARILNATRQNAAAPSRIVVLPGVIGPGADASGPPPQQHYTTSAVPRFEESQYESLSIAAPLPKRRDSGTQIHLDGSNDTEAGPESFAASADPTSQIRPLPRARTMSISSDTGSIYSDHSARSNSPAPPPSSTAASSPPKPLPTPKKAAKKTDPTTPNQPQHKKKGNHKYIQPSRQTTNLPHSPPPDVQFVPATKPIPTEISTLVQRLKSATRKENFPQRTSLRRFEEFDSRYGYLKRSSVLWKEWFGDTRLFTEKWWRYFAMTGKGQELGRGDEVEMAEDVGG